MWSPPDCRPADVIFAQAIPPIGPPTGSIHPTDAPTRSAQGTPTRSIQPAAPLAPARQQEQPRDPTFGDVAAATISRHSEAAGGAAHTGGELLVVAVSGDVDQDTTPFLGAALTDAIDAHHWVCCDLSRVEFFGAAGVNTLLAAHRYAALAGHRLDVRGAHGMTRRVLDITGTDQMLTLPA